VDTPSERDVAVASMLVALRSAHDAVTSYLSGGDGLRSETSAELATIQGDVAVAQRLSIEQHPIQAYSVLRSAWEAAALIDLFQAEPSLADEWMAGRYALFSPAKVRKKLGDRNDPFYSFMCARSHPRFAGMQMSIFQRADTPGGQATHFTEIPFEVPESFMAVSAPGIVLAKLTVLAGHVHFSDASHKRKHLAVMVRNAGSELAKGWSVMDSALTDDDRADPGVHDLAERADWFRQHLQNLADRIEALWPPDGSERSV